MTRLDFLWLLVVGVASSVWCLTAGRELGATFDEPFYVAKGLEAWRTGSNRALMRAGTMPLPVDVQTLPLHLWELVCGEPFDPVSDLPKLLPVARGMNLVFWWPLLVYAGLLGRLWGGAWAGRLAVGLIGCEPNLLAHAALATTDIALTAGVLAAVYHFAVGRGGTWRQRVLVPGIAAGLAVACKASAVTFVPLAWVVINLTPRPPLQSGEGEKIQRPLPTPVRVGEGAGGWGLRDFLTSALVAVVVLFAYCGCDWAVEPSFVKWANGLPDGPLAGAMQFIAEHLRIFPNAGEGIVQQIKHNMRGHGSYALGEYHPRAVWYYFPVVLSAKLPEPLLLLFAGLLVFRPRALLNPAGFIAIAYLLFSLTCRVQIGVRLVFPLVVMLNVAAAVGLFSPSSKWRGGRGVRLLSVLTLLLSICMAVSVWPHGLRHMNRFWGGSFRAADVLTDSNFDWGQGLPELARWQAGAGEPTLHVWYYGADPAILLPPFHVFQVHQLAEPTVEAVKQRVGGGHFAVGASLLTACPDRRPGTLAVIDWIKSQRPVARVGTFVVYRLD